MAIKLVQSIPGHLDRWRQSAKERKSKLLRYVEYKRLKRIRNHQIPQYTFCKNCGEKLLGMYCHKCGQYALNVDQNFLMYIKQFFENAYQFDGKVAQTMWLLFARPGFLSKEFVVGKINSYVHPLKFYMFVSIVFFSFIFMLYSKDEYSDKLVNMTTEKSDVPDSVQMQKAKELHLEALDTLEVDSVHVKKKETDRQEAKKEIKGSYNFFFTQMSQKLPFMLLALLPIFAFLLRFMFRKTSRAYMSHFVFSVHVHTALLVMVSVAVLLNVLTGVIWGYLVMGGLFPFYLLFAVRSFYRNNWVKTVLKTVIISVVYVFIFLVAMIVVLSFVATELDGYWGS